MVTTTEDVMEYKERDAKITSVGYESLVWVRDDEGKEFSCSLDTNRGNVNKFDELTEHEKKSCMDVSQIIGTERW